MIRFIPPRHTLLFALSLTAAGPPTALAQFGVSPIPVPQSDKPYIGPDGHQHDTVTVHCFAELGHTCYFKILRAKGGVVPVKLAATLRTEVIDLEIGKDLFTVKIDQPPPNSFSVCRAEATDTPPCHWGVVKSSINETGNR